MSQDRHKRKLSAIFNADVVGYSRLMEADEEWTFHNFAENKRLISDLIEEYDGRVIDAIGDNLLAEFSSVINSVECAVKIQQELKKKNDNLVKDRRMHFRIGVNLGEVFEEDGRLYGSGVNIASRLEALAEPGGVCISGKTYDHIKTTLGFGYKYLGEHNVKNISEPIKIYRLLMESENAGKIIGEKKVPDWLSSRMAITAVIIIIIIAAGMLYRNIYSTNPGKTEETPIDNEEAALTPEIKKSPNTIAVLPFDDISPDNDQGYFVDGLSEEILNSLSQIPDLGVTGKTSSFSFKDTKKTIQEIAGVLGVDHILEGSVRKAGNELRITAQLVRASDGLHLWSETYDRELKDIFKIQENIANNVADKLKLTLEAFNIQGGTENIKAYELYLVAKGQFYDNEKNRALKSIDEAVALEPKFALAWALKSAVHLSFAVWSAPDRVSLELDTALEAALMAVELEPSLWKAYFSLGDVYTSMGKFIEAGKVFQKGMELRTAESTNYYEDGLTGHYSIVGYSGKSKKLFEEILRNDPLKSILRSSYILILGHLGYTERAEEEYERGKILFGDKWRLDGDFFITVVRLGTKNAVSPDEIPYSSAIFDAAKKYLDSPEDGLTVLRRIYIDNPELSPAEIEEISVLAAYLGDPEFALKALEKSVMLETTRLFTYWAPVFHEVRQLPRFKEFVREIGLVDFWQEYGWPDLCHPAGDDDFVCD